MSRVLRCLTRLRPCFPFRSEGVVSDFSFTLLRVPKQIVSSFRFLVIILRVRNGQDFVYEKEGDVFRLAIQ